MDKASQVLIQALPLEVPRTYAALAEQRDVTLTTLHHRAHGRRSKKQKAQTQQYLIPSEEKAFMKFLLQMSDLGSPVRAKFLSSWIARQCITSNKAVKPPGKNWARAFEKRHPESRSRKVRAIDWNRHENNIYDKIKHLFEVIEKVL